MSKSKRYFSDYSIFFLILMLLVLVGSYKLRSGVTMPTAYIDSYANFFNRFAIPVNFVTSHAKLFLKLDFFVSLGIIILGYFLGKEIAGKTEGAAVAIFLGFYPYFIANCYSTISFSLILFMFYLYFVLKAYNSFYKVWSIPAGIFFALSIIANPACMFICFVPHIYYAEKSKNIAVLHMFLFFVLGALIGLAPFMLYTLIKKLPFEHLIPFMSTFKPFVSNLSTFIASSINYFNNSIVPFFSNTLAKPKYYISINSYAYLHYVIITLSLLSMLYAFIEERIKLIFFIFILLLIQALFMPIGFELLFLLLIFMASYMIDKVVKDVFCEKRS